MMNQMIDRLATRTILAESIAENEHICLQALTL
jgi:hypothetical protein